jgi:poly(A) polymerase
MNALYCDAHGEITDFFGGVEDAKADRIAFIGDAKHRISEDALRILRFFRFFAHYGQKAMDEAGLNACTALAPMIDRLSGERIQQEMLKLLVAQNAGPVVGLMQACTVLLPVLGCKIDIEPITLLPSLLRATKEKPDAILSLAALLRSAESDAEECAEWIYVRWKLSNAHRKQLHLLCTTNIQLTNIEALTKRQIRVLGKQDFIQLMLLYAAEGAEQDAVFAAIALARSWDIPVFPVTGEDLKAKGVAQGKALGEKLKELETAWEKGGYKAGKDELLKL